MGEKERGDVADATKKATGEHGGKDEIAVNEEGIERQGGGGAAAGFAINEPGVGRSAGPGLDADDGPEAAQTTIIKSKSNITNNRLSSDGDDDQTDPAQSAINSSHSNIKNL